MEGLTYRGKFAFQNRLGQFNEGFFAIPVRGAYIWRGDLTDGFLCYRFGGLIFGGAYTWRGLFSEFYGISVVL